MDKKLLKKYLFGDSTIRRLLMSVAFIYVSLALFAWFFSDRLIYQPPACSYEGEKGYASIKLPNGDSITANVWLHPDARYTLLYNHGNAVDLGQIRHHMEAYRDLGFNVVAYDYPGYGASDGRPSTRGARDAAEAAFQYASQLTFSSDQIIIHGRSVGSGPAVHLAKNYEVGGLILENAFVSAFRVQTRIPVFPFDKWRNLKSIDEVNCPVLVIHGSEDQTIPIWHGEKLFAKAKDPKMKAWISGMTHESLTVEAEEEYWKAIQALEEFVFQQDAQGLEVIGLEFCELHQKSCRQEIVEVKVPSGGSHAKGYLKEMRAVKASLFPNAYNTMSYAKPGTEFAKSEGGKRYVRYYCDQCRQAKRDWGAAWRAAWKKRQREKR